MHPSTHMCGQKHKHMHIPQDTHNNTNVIMAEIFIVEFQK